MPRVAKGRTRTHPAAGGLALLSLLLPAPGASAGDVIAPAPSISTTPSAVQENQNSNPMQVFAPTAAGLGRPIEPFRWGPATLRPHLDYRFLYGSGIASSPGQPQDTIVQQAAPGILIDVGDHWTLDYTPTLNFYSNRAFNNTVDHSISLEWGTPYNDWFFSASQGVSISSDPLVETGAQTDHQNYSTMVRANYQFNDKMSLDSSVSQNLNFLQSSGSTTNSLQNLANSQSWSTLNWLNYEFWPRLNAGLGAGAGYSQQENSADAVSEQVQGRVNWRATDKISFQINSGLFVQQYLSGGAGDLLTPVFGGTIQYQPFEHTRISVGASRSVSAAYFQSQFTENTSINVGLNQRLLGWLYLDLGGAYATTHYVTSSNDQSSSRDDKTSTFSARLSTHFAGRGSIAVFYQYSHNSSTQSGFATSESDYSYYSSQIGFEIGYRY